MGIFDALSRGRRRKSLADQIDASSREALQRRMGVKSILAKQSLWGRIRCAECGAPLPKAAYAESRFNFGFLCRECRTFNEL